MSNKLSTIVITLLLVCLNTLIYCQSVTDEEVRLKHEIKVNTLFLIPGFSFLDASYEYTSYKNNSSVGITGGISLQESNLKYRYLMPYYKVFFDDNLAKGFFLETHLLLGREIDSFRDTNSFAFGGGLAIGTKFKRDIVVVETLLGMGRTLNEYDGFYEFYPRIGLNFGLSLF